MRGDPCHPEAHGLRLCPPQGHRLTTEGNPEGDPLICGQDITIIRRVISTKKKKKQNLMKFEAQEAFFETYMRALGLIDY